MNKYPSIQQFRIWEPEAKVFHYSGGTPKMLASFFDFTAPLHTVHKMPYQRATGLTDKNGKEIYEGDIVELKNMPDQIDVDHMQGIVPIWFNPESVKFEGKSHVPLDWGGTESVEVIGNIYENAELLTV